MKTYSHESQNRTGKREKKIPEPAEEKTQNRAKEFQGFVHLIT